MKSAGRSMSKKLKRTLLGSLLLLLAVLVLPLIPYGVDAWAANDTAGSSAKVASVPNPGIDLWNAVRGRGEQVPMTTQVTGIDSNTFMNIQGQAWREYRMNDLIPISAYLLGGVLLAIVLFRLIRGIIPIAAGRSGETMLRFTLSQRTIHWLVAITFIVLALTGLTLTYGRFVLIPLLGANGFGATAAFAKLVHDYVGPVFGVGLVIMLFAFIKGNFISFKTDLMWVLKGGGFFGKHVKAGRYNFGEKAWFWLVMSVGGAVVFSGLVLDFPVVAALVGDSRTDKEFYHVIHSIAAVALFAASFGHIYMGTAAMEGTFEIMKTGYADTNWVKEHHSEWYAEMVEQGNITVEEKTAPARVASEAG